MFWLFPSVVFVKRETSDGRWVRAGWRPYLLTYFLTLLLNVFYRVSLGFIWSYWVLLGFTGLYWVILGFTGLYWVILGFIGLYWLLLGFTGFYLVLYGFTGFYWVLLGFTGFSLVFTVSPGFIRFYWVLLGFSCTRWVLKLSTICCRCSSCSFSQVNLVLPSLGCFFFFTRPLRGGSVFRRRRRNSVTNPEEVKNWPKKGTIKKNKIEKKE